MHLHGFYYRVDSRGTWSGDTIYSPADRRQVVTELLLPGETMATQWGPTVAGNWLMHCHFAFHASHFMSLASVPDPVDAGSADAVMEAVHSMAGLILGIQVRDRNPSRAAPVLAAAPAPRTIRLLINSARARYDTSVGYGFVPQEVPRAIPSDSVPVLSPPLILHRGERTRINVVNQLRAPSSIHWHGIELSDSYFDGVPGWSGMANRLAPLIAPHDSFSVELTPPRAGTFMYHSHSNETHQISSGMYGALIVLDSGQTFDPTVDRVFVVGENGPDFNHGRLNGQLQPTEQTLVAGTTYRFRIVSINPDWRVYVSLKADSIVQQWRAIAKDGADLPAHQATMRTARILMGPGETADFSVTPRTPGRMTLDVTTQLDGWSVAVPLRVVSRTP
jgi:FtsP/CotA-like multicopper oxidase with cupredoxin domain